jgi:pimeloyl-ACP methyl ester carboxylesterase
VAACQQRSSPRTTQPSRGWQGPLYPAQRPLTLSAGFEPSGTPAYTTIPSWYVLGTRDLIITSSAQQFMATRANSTITRIPTGHLGLISDPSPITKVIEQAAQATR